MKTYRIHRLREHLRRQFRFAPHVSGCAQVKPRDYEAAGSIQATSPYQAFFTMRDGGTPLDVGDLLEAEDGALRIFKFVGFDEAVWVFPEAKVAPEPVEAGGEPGSAEPGNVTEPATA